MLNLLGYTSMDLKGFKTLIKAEFDVNLSTANKDSSEAISLLSRLFHDEPEKTSVANSYRILKHFNFSFHGVVSCDMTSLIMQHTSFRISIKAVDRNNDYVVVTNDLKSLVDDITSLSKDKELCLLMNPIQLGLEKLGLGPLFPTKKQKIGYFLL